MADSITTLSLCSGVGWLDEAVAAGCRYFGWRHRVAAYCEWEAYAASVLLARMEESSLEPAPVWSGDLGQFDGKEFRGTVDGITAGFPCQPWSNAGSRLGTEDDRWLWPAIVRIIDDVEPGFVFLENVSALIAGGGLERCLSDLAKMRFDAEWLCLTAGAVGAAHRRERVFILAHDPGARGRGLPDAKEWSADRDSDGSRGGLLADSASVNGNKRKRQRVRPATDGGTVCRPKGHGEVVAHADRARRPPSERHEQHPELESTGGCAERGDSRQSAGERHSGGIPRSQAEGGGERLIDGNQPDGPESAGAAVAVSGSDGGRSSQPRRRSGWGSVSGGSGGDMADSERDGLGGCRRAPAIVSDERCDRPIFAPGPAADWSGIEEYLWPATERGFRVLVDGSAVVLDESRADQLRCSGNGVVALQAGVAFVELVRRTRIR